MRAARELLGEYELLLVNKFQGGEMILPRVPASPVQVLDSWWSCLELRDNQVPAAALTVACELPLLLQTIKTIDAICVWMAMLSTCSTGILYLFF